ncbi:cyclic-phosphate processing receiver domain-containing protein [Nocardia sp. NPDC051833]|uniref:cyclic-phosphate processing receiver domain-containing protein n=1 Tax=Nocardia sp. NPDC051833 TaxID=3155674 RepID=UPI0034122FE3
MKLFVDDERPAPTGWMLVKTAAAALAIINGHRLAGVPLSVLSLDHDLGTSIATYEDETTRPIMLWMCEHDWWPDALYVHTANPAGQDWLVGMARRYAPPGTLRGYGQNYWGTCTVDDIERHPG